MGDANDTAIIGNVYELVYRNSANQTASQNDVEQGWVQFYDLWNNTLIPGASNADDMLSAFTKRECTYLVETGCMTVVWKMCTCTDGACTTSAELALPELTIALGG